MPKENSHSKEYKKSLNRCPLCGTVVGCTDTDGYTICSAEEFHKHIQECREASRVKPVKTRYTSDDE